MDHKELRWQILVWLRLMPKWKLQAYRIWKLSGNGVETVKFIRNNTGMSLTDALNIWRSEIRGPVEI